MAKLKSGVIAAENSVSHDPSEILFISWFGDKDSLNAEVESNELHLLALL